MLSFLAKVTRFLTRAAINRCVATNGCVQIETHACVIFVLHAPPVGNLPLKINRAPRLKLTRGPAQRFFRDVGAVPCVASRLSAQVLWGLGAMAAEEKRHVEVECGVSWPCFGALRGLMAPRGTAWHAMSRGDWLWG